jgi:hypothetical protein
MSCLTAEVMDRGSIVMNEVRILPIARPATQSSVSSRRRKGRA